jgi:hypothetical protein
MEKIFENVTRLTTRKEYDTVRAHIELLIKEATAGGYFSEPEGDNEYIREFGRLARLSALYEDEFMDLGFIIPKTETASAFEHINSPLEVDADLLLEYA